MLASHLYPNPPSKRAVVGTIRSIGTRGGSDERNFAGFAVQPAVRKRILVDRADFV
jgi:hypothetical protein